MKKTSLFLIILLLIIGGALAWTFTKKSEDVAKKSNSPSVDSAANTFSFELFQGIQKNQPDVNVVVSPYSVSTALSLVYNGAEGETKKELEKTLNITESDRAVFNEEQRVIQERLESDDPSVQMYVANSIWINDEKSVKPSFVKTIQDAYDAEAQTLNFRDAKKSADIINAWVSEQTRETIPTILDSTDPGMLSYLLNAIYFKGAWTTTFDPKNTQEKPFTLLSGEQTKRPSMSQYGKFNYLENDELQAIELPYGKEKAFSMYVFLPAKESSLQEFLNTLSQDTYNDLLSQLENKEGTIMLPRFTIEYEKSLNDALTELGIEQAFNAELADFSSLSDDPAWISEVRHKTFMKVNEEGTEAAAVTSISLGTTEAVEEDPPFSMQVNRPFFFVIRHNALDAVLFMGAIVNPEE